MNVKEIIAKWLKDNGYDGLRSDGEECGCKVDDLFPCDGPVDTCLPGYEGPDPTGECFWMIYLSRDAVAAAERQEADHG